tara:strand:- start:954 stop:1130 length:177 start_codon:yes stop_codon:yes gene_type:complete
MWPPILAARILVILAIFSRAQTPFRGQIVPIDTSGSKGQLSLDFEVITVIASEQNLWV